MNSTLHEILLDFVALIYPQYCLACECALVKGEDTVCTRCMIEMPKTDYHLDRDNLFFRKLQGRVTLKYVMALFKFTKEGRVQQLLHTLKYKNHPEIGMKLGELYGLALKEDYNAEFDIIIPVPLHISRQRTRGYNQSAEFGKGLSAILEIPCREDVLLKVLRTETQTRKTKLNRWENVNKVFIVSNLKELKGKRVLLVDDVITTGATLEACAKILLDHHCKNVSIACIAATQ